MAFFRKKEGMLGLDIGGHLVKLVEVRREDQRHQLANIGVAQIFQVSEGEKVPHKKLVVDTIRSLLSSSEFETSEVALAMSSREVIVKRIEMDRMSEDEVGQIIKWEAEQHIPFNIDDVYVDFHILDSAGEGDQMDVLLVAGKRTNVDSRIELAVAAGLDPVIVDVDAFAIQNAFELSYPETFEDVVCLLDIGRDVTVISLIHRGIPLFNRDIPFGGIVFVDQMRKKLGISVEDAESYVLGINPDGISDGEVRPVISAGSEDLVVGITRTFSYLKTLGEEEKPSRIYLSGGGARIPGLLDVLEDRLSIPLEIANPLRGLDIRENLLVDESVEDISPLLMQAIGLGLR